MFWYEEEIATLCNRKKELVYEPKLFFYGSSSIRLWNSIYDDFVDYEPINLGFGGSSLAACTWYFERIFSQHIPQAIIIYAGENDLADGRHPEEIILFLERLIDKIRLKFKYNIPITYISIKPSFARWYLKDSIVYTNKLAKELEEKYSDFHFINVYNQMLNIEGKPNPLYFEADGLHMNKLSYELWNNILKANLQIFPNKAI